METNFKILGSGAGPGLPSFFCDCVGCREARSNPELARTRSGALIDTYHSKILVDASPDLRRQLIKENITYVDCVFLTHWHYDHFGGLGELEYYVKLERKKEIPLFLPPSAIAQFAAAFPNLADIFVVKEWEFNRQYFFGEVCLTPLPANHGIETAGFLLESKGRKLAYFPDTAGLPEISAKQASGVDWLVCDATFHGDNWYPMVHMSMEQAIDLGKKVGAKNTVLTHLAIHYSQAVTTKQLQEESAKYQNVFVAYDGMNI
ncbi:MAG TPA: MBL fold metallo-hydrolase, partial [Negativicutes bacterium]